MNWQTSLAQGLNDPKSLLAYLGHESNCGSHDADLQFRTKVPRHFANKMAREDLNCPLLKQVLPVTQELIQTTGFVSDPLQEARFNRMPGLLHKYKSRVLVTLAGSCAVNCRYCFRRHFSYKDNQINLQQWHNIVDYIQENQQLEEVIFSGGDPLMVKNERLSQYIKSLQALNHINTIRFHTRLPVVLPERIDEGFVELVEQALKHVVMVVHVNHPQELCKDTFTAFEKLKKAGVTLLNQSVLLAGVNDSVDILKQLSQKLFAQSVLPYYLHLPDKVSGTAHFDVSLEKAKELHKALQAQVSGYLVPKLVQEVAGEKHKTWL